MRPVPSKSRLSTYTYLIALAGRLVLGFLALFVAEMALQGILGPRVEARYGFELGSPYVMAGGDDVEVPVIERVDSGGAFARAGLVEGDILVNHISKGLLYLSLLLAGTGDTRRVTVVSGGDGPEIGQRRKRRLTVVAP
jgi:S1-C subfamily serine protease